MVAEGEEEKPACQDCERCRYPAQEGIKRETGIRFGVLGQSDGIVAAHRAGPHDGPRPVVLVAAQVEHGRGRSGQLATVDHQVGACADLLGYLRDPAGVRAAFQVVSEMPTLTARTLPSAIPTST